MFKFVYLPTKISPLLFPYYFKNPGLHVVVMSLSLFNLKNSPLTLSFLKITFPWSSSIAQWVKYLALSLHWLRLWLWLGFNPWPRNFLVLSVHPK